jgi:hypothetical protein
MKQEHIYNKWKEFIDKYEIYFQSNEEIWYIKLSNIINYIEINKKIPSENDKSLRDWIRAQNHNYIKKEGIMKQDHIYYKYKEFMDKYKKYFLSNEEIWLNKLNKVIDYIKVNNKSPSPTDKNNDIKILGRWISMQHQNYKKKIHIMTNKIIYNEWSTFIDIYKEYIQSYEEVWLSNLNKVIEYIKINKKLPPIGNKNKDIHALGAWISQQINNHKKRIYIMKQEHIYNKWIEFINMHMEYFLANEELWLSNLNKVIEYIKVNKKRPPENDKNTDIDILALARWTGAQIRNFAKKERIMKQNNIYNTWKEFMDKYKEYFLSNEEIWLNYLNKVIEYIKVNKNIPSTNDKDTTIKSLGLWVSRQHEIFDKKKYIMKNNVIYDSWKEFINKYKEYFISNEDIWLNNLNQVIEYIDNNKMRPSQHDAERQIKILGAWISQQINNHRKRIYIMKQEHIYNRWTIFIEKYKEYFQSNEDQWKLMLNKLEIYINTNKKRPSDRDKNNDIKVLGKWKSHQQTNYKKKVNIMKNKEIYDKWTIFIEKYKEYFDKSILETKEIKIEIPVEEKVSTSIKVNRPEQDKLRQYLIQNKENKCVVCNIKKPVKLLIAAHLRPRCDVDKKERYDHNIVEFMCHDCHKLYDDGDIGICNGNLSVKDIDEYPQYKMLVGKNIECYNNKNKVYFDYHFQNIYNTV